MADPTDKEIEARKGMAGKFGFILGCVAAVLAFAIELFIAPKPLTGMSVLTAALMAAINVPMGIVLGLVGERMTRGKGDDDAKR
jgi:hypothetical protein